MMSEETLRELVESVRQEGLPAGWTAQVSRSTGDTYYVNDVTLDSTYDRPVAAAVKLSKLDTGLGLSEAPPPHEQPDVAALLMADRDLTPRPQQQLDSEPEPPAFQVIQTPVEGVADGMVGAFASQLTGGSGKLASADHSKVSARIRAGGKAKAKKKSAGAARSRNGFYDSSDSSDSDSEPASKVAASQEPKPAAAAKRKATTATKPTAASNKWTNPAPKKVPEKRQAVAPPPPQKLVVTEQMVAEKMAEFDADGNGVLDTEEVAALLEAMADLTTAARNASPERSRSPETRGRDQAAAAAAAGGGVWVVTAAEVAE
jgi:hypothetical protein